jgi:hypothetical protein
MGRSYGRRGYPATTGRVTRPNARPGECRGCGEEIPAGGGHLWREAGGAWSVVHLPQEWAGSPTSGQYVGGCPAETDCMNTAGGFGGPDGPRLESDRIASVAAVAVATMPERSTTPRGSYRRGGRYGYTSSGARVSERCGHEDYPCCGC